MLKAAKPSVDAHDLGVDPMLQAKAGQVNGGPALPTADFNNQPRPGLEDQHLEHRHDAEPALKVKGQIGRHGRITGPILIDKVAKRSSSRLLYSGPWVATALALSDVELKEPGINNSRK